MEAGVNAGDDQCWPRSRAKPQRGVAECYFQTFFPLPESLLSIILTIRYIYLSLCVCVCVFVGKMMVQLGADRVVPFLWPIVLHQARRDVISLSQAHAPTMLHYLCVCECIFILQTMLHYMSLSGLPEHFFLSHYPV